MVNYISYAESFPTNVRDKNPAFFNIACANYIAYQSYLRMQKLVDCVRDFFLT